MPRYAKGSLNEALYEDIRAIFIQTDLQTINPHERVERDPNDKVRAIRSMVQMQALGLVTVDNFLRVVNDILRE